MSEMKQTAVEWFMYELANGKMPAEEAYKQALEMEKDNIIEAYNDGQNNPYEYSEDNEVNWYDGKNYYNEIFKQE